MTAARKPAAAKNRTLLVQRQNGTEFKVTIPATARVTLSGFNPGKSVKSEQQYGGRYHDGRTPGDNRPTLRIYEGTTQRAAFVNIEGFRDLSYEFEEKVETVDEIVETVTDTLGNLSRRQKREVIAKWLTDNELDDYVPSPVPALPA